MRTVTYSWLAVVIGVACAAIGWLGIAGWMAVAAVAASIAAHVAGNALGTKLREATDRDLAKTRLRQQAVVLPLPRQPANLERRASRGSPVVVEIVRTSLREAIRAEQTSAAGVEQP